MYNFFSHLVCNDVVDEILHCLDSRSVASLLSVNKYMSTHFLQNNTIVDRKRLAEELKRTMIKKRKYYKCNILKFDIGDRLTDRIYNYKVMYVASRYAVLHVVDMYGNKISNIDNKGYNMDNSVDNSVDNNINNNVDNNVDNIVYTTIHNFKNNKNNLAWATWHQYDNTAIQIKLLYGIMKHKCGPMIMDVDSKYLSYITQEQHILMPYLVGEPMMNMMVTIDHKMHIYEYIIVYLTDNKMRLRNTENNHQLYATKQDKWVIDNYKYSIIMFGGFKYI